MEKKEYMQLSRTAYNEFQARLEHLKNTRRLEVAQHIREARAFGDISENAEYDAAMNEQSALEAEIAQLEDLLAHVEVLDESAIDLSSVSVGTRITVHLVEHDHTETYDIVSTTESDPFGKRVKVRCDGSERNKSLGYKEGEVIIHEFPPKLSNDSPVGHALLGHKVGETIEVAAPSGFLHYQILSIERTPDAPTGTYLDEEFIG
ncbi:MAG: transcription elongation factor GreA [Christensenellales bacterium]|jgi:transcription elongation factor GreA